MQLLNLQLPSVLACNHVCCCKIPQTIGCLQGLAGWLAGCCWSHNNPSSMLEPTLGSMAASPLWQLPTGS
jgi:hypothetical protein